MSNLKGNRAPKAQKTNYYSSLPTEMKARQDVHPAIVRHFESNGISFKWLNANVLTKNNNLHHADYHIWSPPAEIKAELAKEGVPFSADGTIRKGGDLVLGVITNELKAKKRAYLKKKNEMLAGVKEAKKAEFSEHVKKANIGSDIDTSYGEDDDSN